MLDILSILAILPGVVLVILVYKMDRIEKEPISFILRLLWTGIVSTFFAAIIEVLGELFLYNLFGESFITNFLMYFLVVGGAEEGVKYFSFMKFAWNNREFNYKFDAIVYSVSISMGFAIYENIKYVKMFGMGTAVARAFSSVPGHAIFAIIMGMFLGKARAEENYSTMYGPNKSKFYKRMALIVPMLVHGLYDFLLVSETTAAYFGWFILLMLMYWFAYIILTRCSKDDEYIGI